MADMRDPDPFQLFLFATAYWRAAAALTKGLNLHYPYNMPTFVVEAFSLELHLKCLLRLRGQLLDPTHEPNDLFRRLAPADQQSIRSLGKLLPSDEDLDIEPILARARGVFKTLRYMHEGHEWPRDATGLAGNAGFDETIRGTRRTILEISPAWSIEYKRILGTHDEGAMVPETLSAKSLLLIPPSTGP